MNAVNKKWRTVLLVALAELMAISLWFAAAAVMPQLMDVWQIEAGQAAWLTMAVQIGFVAGAFTSIFLRLADRWPPRLLFAGGALLGALSTALIPLVAVALWPVLALRFITGFALAAAYPIGMKLITTWMKEDRGLGMGILAGALAVGCASPHLVRVFGGIADWRLVLYVVACLAALGGLIVLRWGESGPYSASAASFRWRDVGDLWRNRGVRLANFGYLGHMWESYAMWTWIPLFLLESYRLAGEASWLGQHAETAAAVVAFMVIAIGGAGSLLGGNLADRWGRSRTTIASMTASGACALLIGLLFGQSPLLVTLVALVWGFTIVADSGQFGVAISELSARETVGTALTLQLSLGFILTLISIRIIPMLVEAIGWQGAFMILALGPALGSWAMWRLWHSPDAALMAGGRG